MNFGNVVANSKVIAREVTIYNHGAKEGEFKIKYHGDKPIAIIPSSGKVPANSAQVIKVEYVTKTPGPFDEVAKCVYANFLCKCIVLFKIIDILQLCHVIFASSKFEYVKMHYHLLDYFQSEI